MPQLGEIIKSQELGIKGYYKYIWIACPDCGARRWVTVVHGKPFRTVCRKCSNKKRGRQGSANGHWKGGRIKSGKKGYVHILLRPDDFFHRMTNKNYVLEHRLIMAKHLNRCLLAWEVVHHRNGLKDDNRLENLQLLPSRPYHISDTHLKSRVSKLEKQVLQQAKRITLLEADNILLRQRNESVQGTIVT